MTQEFVTLPREVVELAIEALFCTDSEEGSTAYENELKAVKKLRAALDQPQANQPAMTPIAQRKLDSLLAEGYTISGYSVYHEQKHQHGFVTSAGMVGWWRPEGVEYPQPQVEQEPLCWVTGYYGGKCTVAPRNLATVLPVGTALYTHPQPKREPLTLAQIAEVFGWKPGYLPTPDQVYDARAIEAAHNIK